MDGGRLGADGLTVNSILWNASPPLLSVALIGISQGSISPAYAQLNAPPCCAVVGVQFTTPVVGLIVALVGVTGLLELGIME